jgi:hypothetical protein
MRQLLIFLLILSSAAGVMFAQDDSSCPTSRLKIGGQGQVTPGSANNVRDTPSRDGAKVGEIPAGGIFDVLEGPTCADGFNWWRVDYDGIVGWTVEGQGEEYFLEPYRAVPTPTLPPLRDFVPPIESVNVLEVGARVRVTVDDGDTLTLRREPAGERLGQIEDGAVGVILEGPVEEDNLRWWQIETTEGNSGWVIEGLLEGDTYQRTLLPLCEETEDRIAFIAQRYLYTANEDMSEPCIFEALRVPELYTFYPYFMRLPNNLIWSPDNLQLMYVDIEADGLQDLYLMAADGSERREITRDSDVYWVDWSPDGERLVFTRSLENGKPQVWTMRKDGTALSALTDGSESRSWAQWLNDSDTVIYADELSESSSLQQIYIPREYVFKTVSVTRGGLREIYRTKLDLHYVALSPDTSHLALRGFRYTEEEPYEALDIEFVVINTATGETLFIEFGIFNSFVWTPDGNHIVLVGEESLTLMPIDRTQETVEIALSAPITGARTSPAWSSDGKALFYYDEEELIFYRIDIETGEVERMVTEQ